jgi:competence protein CoiA
MSFRAVHEQWGAVFAHLPGLGCGQAWETVWKVRPAAPLTCDECGHRMFAKVSRNGLRFFAHAPGAPSCALALETIAHHMLKLELANAARDAGAHAEMEVRGPDGTWRADVLASDPGGAWRTALEAQLAPIAADDITARSDRMRADGVASIWFSDRPRPPWLGAVPSVRLARPDDGQGLVVAEGLMKFDGHWQDVPATLVQFLGWAFTGRIVPYKPRAGVLVKLYLATFWTAPRYIRACDDEFAELERRAEQNRRAEEAHLRSLPRLPLTRSQINRARAAAQSSATEAEQAARSTARNAAWRERAARRPDVAGAIALLDRKWGVPAAAVGWSIGDPRYAGGIPLFNAAGALRAVLGPDPRRIVRENFALLAGTLLLFSGKDRHASFNRVMKRYDPKPLGGWQTDFVDAVQEVLDYERT